MKSNVISDNCIYFTNLDTVKCKKFESSNNLFFSHMHSLINSDINNYSVSYDRDNDLYTITYEGDTYSVKYKNDDLTSKCEDENIVDLLNRLVSISRIQRELVEEEHGKSDYLNKKREKVLFEAKRGIINTNDKKRAKIELLKEEYKNNKSGLFHNVWVVFKDICVGKVPKHYYIYHFGLTFLDGIILIVLAATVGANSLFWWLFGFLFVAGAESICTVSSSLDGQGYRGLLVTLFSIAILPINILYNIGQKIVDKLLLNKKINKIKSSIVPVSLNKDNNISYKKIHINNLSKYINEVAKNSFSKAPTDFRKTYQVINGLKDRILLIDDKSISSKFAKELYEIISYYLDASINIKEKIKVSNILTNQITDLSKRVDEILIKEKEEEEEKNSCNTMMETIRYEKSIR